MVPYRQKDVVAVLLNVSFLLLGCRLWLVCEAVCRLGGEHLLMKHAVGESSGRREGVKARSRLQGISCARQRLVTLARPAKGQLARQSLWRRRASDANLTSVRELDASAEDEHAQ